MNNIEIAENKNQQKNNINLKAKLNSKQLKQFPGNGAKIWSYQIQVLAIARTVGSYSVCASTEIEPQGTMYCLNEINFESRSMLL